MIPVWGVSGWRKSNKIDRKTDDYVGEEDVCRGHIFGIQELNKVEKALTATPAIIYWKNVCEWTDYDYQFLRMTKDYDRNWEKRKKVLEYLSYQRGLKKLK